MTRLPVFNLGEFENSTGSSREKHCEDLDKFCSKIGFLLVENHGVPDNVIESQWTAVEQFFSQKNFAWLLDDREEKNFIKLMKKATNLIVKARTIKGAETTDHYSMMGFTKAYNTAKKTCG